MEYKKSPLTYEEQADRFLSRGLIADRDKLIEILKNVNYYRLSGYLHPFRKSNGIDDCYIDGTNLQIIWRRYTFDRQLRFLILDAIERVEVALRSRLVHLFVFKYGSFGYLHKNNFPNLKRNDYCEFFYRVMREIGRSQEVFVKHFDEKYGDEHHMPPLWIACELFSFGSLLTFYRGVDKSLKQSLAREVGVADEVLSSWLDRLNVIRNFCAHHARVWNKDFPIQLPKNLKKYPDWFYPVEIKAGKIFCILTILKYLLSIAAPDSQWHKRLKGLFLEYPEIPLQQMGFPNDWKKAVFWEDR